VHEVGAPLYGLDLHFAAGFGEGNESLICLVVAYQHLRNKFFLAVFINKDWIAENAINRAFQGMNSTCSCRG
jgi:hypothetical protein